LALLNVEDAISRIPLDEDDLILLVIGDGDAAVCLAEKYLRVKFAFCLPCHDDLRRRPDGCIIAPSARRRQLFSCGMLSRKRDLGDDNAVEDKVALLNIGAYHSVDVRSFASLLALLSSRVSLGWAQDVLFPEAEAGKRIVICLRSASYN